MTLSPLLQQAIQALRVLEAAASSSSVRADCCERRQGAPALAAEAAAEGVARSRRTERRHRGASEELCPAAVGVGAGGSLSISGCCAGDAGGDTERDVAVTRAEAARRLAAAPGASAMRKRRDRSAAAASAAPLWASHNAGAPPAAACWRPMLRPAEMKTGVGAGGAARGSCGSAAVLAATPPSPAAA